MAQKLKHYRYYVSLETPSGGITADSSANAKRAIRKEIKTQTLKELIHKIHVWEIPEEDYEIYGLQKPTRRKTKK